ncbi:MAG: hypothetical protein CL974_01575 [Euryarchaeota archaeon]|nr:hypothetical protein [Euryarchaeota archaeon]
MESTESIFQPVRDTLDKGSTLYYEPAIKATEHAIRIFDKAEGKEFLDKYLLKICSIVTEQQPGRCDNFCHFIDKLIEFAAIVIMKSVAIGEPLRYLPCFFMILDKNRLYYSGNPHWGYSQNYRGIRMRYIKAFVQKNTFDSIISAIHQIAVPRDMISMRDLHVLVTILADGDTSQELKKKFLEVITSTLINATDEQMKADHTDSMREVLNVLREICPESAYRSVLLKFTSRLLSSSILISKIFGLSLTKEILAECKMGNGPALRYKVFGAGSPEVDGIYMQPSHKTRSQLCKYPCEYIKPAQGRDAKEMALYRWVMHGNTEENWFIGVKVTGNSDSEEYIDFYQHVSQQNDWMEPPANNWQVCDLNGVNRTLGKNPTPRIERIDDAPVHNNFSKLVSAWARRSSLLGLVISTSSHIEVIKQSKDLIFLLAETDGLNEDDIKMICSVAFNSFDETHRKESVSLLAITSPCFRDDLYAKFIDILSEEMNTHEKSSVERVGNLLSKICDEGTLYFDTLSQESASALMKLVLELLRHPMYEKIREGKNIEGLLTLCLNSSNDRSTLTLDLIRRCTISMKEGQEALDRDIDMIALLISEHANSDTVMILHNEDFGTCIQDELIRCVKASRQEIDQTSSASIVAGASDEVTSATTVSHLNQIRSRINKRLELFRRFYGKSQVVNMDFEVMNRLWLFLCFSHEREEFLKFLGKAAPSAPTTITSDDGLHIGSTVMQRKNAFGFSFTHEDSEEFYIKVLCNSTVQWNELQQEGFNCLESFFNYLCASRGKTTRRDLDLGQGLGQYPSSLLAVSSSGISSSSDDDSAQESRRDELVKAGIDLFWRVALSCSSDQIALLAMKQIINYSEEHECFSNSSMLDVTSIASILTRIKEVLEGVAVEMDDQQMLRISRCLKFLLELITTSSHGEDDDSNTFHAGRGHLSLMKITVNWRKPDSNSLMGRSNASLYNSSSPATPLEVTSTLNNFKNYQYEEGCDTMMVYPLTTISQLKRQLCDIMKVSNPAVITLDVEKSLTSSSSCARVCDLGLADNSTITATALAGSSDTTIITPYRDEPILPSVAMYIASDAQFFNNIMLVANRLRKVHDDISLIAWDVLMMVPTQTDLMKTVKDALKLSPLDVNDNVNYSSNGNNNNSGDGAILTSLLNENINDGQIATATYILQIVGNLLHPFKSISGNSNRTDNAKMDRVLLNNFISNGFQSALFLFLRLGKEFSDDHMGRQSERIIVYLLKTVLTTVKYSDNGHQIVQLLGTDVSVLVTKLMSDVPMPLILTETTTVVETSIAFHNKRVQTHAHETTADSISVLNIIADTPEISALVMDNERVTMLMENMLRSESVDVRNEGLKLILLIGKADIESNKSTVYEWLIHLFSTTQLTDTTCNELTKALQVLSISRAVDDSAVLKLVNMVSDRLLTFPDPKTDTDMQVYLESVLCLQAVLLKHNFAATSATNLGKQLVDVILRRFLLAIPVRTSDPGPVCRSTKAREAGFDLLYEVAAKSENNLLRILQAIEGLKQNSFSGDYKYHHHMSEKKRSDIQFTGLKNQGCTCYLNSTVQQLFMIEEFRESVLRVKIPCSDRTTLSHLDDDMIVGKDLEFEWQNNIWKVARITSKHDYGEHDVAYYNDDGQLEKPVRFNIRQGREGCETGRARLVPVDIEKERDEGVLKAYHILEQLQRTFYFMKYCMSRYYDPKPLVDACKVLNMASSVYQQNCAGEFYTTFLDKIEIAMKHSAKLDERGQDLLNEINRAVQCKISYRKIPQDCVNYVNDKTTCGHWQSGREEPQPCIILDIGTNANDLETAVRNYCADEMMDGDNKIECEVCVEKKDTLRRTSLTLPNYFAIHLKRFDLDFETLQTIKKNSRMSFPPRLNVKDVSKEGMEEQERQAELESSISGASPLAGKSPMSPVPMGLRYEEAEKPPLDDADFEYVLQGVLVHSGIAQGGHYYSYARNIASLQEDSDQSVNKSESSPVARSSSSIETNPSGISNTNNDSNEPQWYLFDDEEVATFDSTGQFEQQCFGGPANWGSAGSNGKMDPERTKNALMLFYAKVRKNKSTTATTTTTTGSVQSPNSNNHNNDGPILPVDFDGDTLIDGYQAFREEVQDNNMRQVVFQTLLDGALHNFMAKLMSIVPVITEETSEWARNLFLEGVHFFKEFVLPYSSRARQQINVWMYQLKRIFKDSFMASSWFIQEILSDAMNHNQMNQLQEYFMRENDSNTRKYVADLIAITATCVAKFHPQNAFNPRNPTNLSRLLQQLVQMVTHRGQKRMIGHSEVVGLLRDLAIVPAFGKHLIESRYLYDLISVITNTSDDRSGYGTKYGDTGMHGHGQYGLGLKGDAAIWRGAYEVIAAIFGIPPEMEVPLLKSYSVINEDLDQYIPPRLTSDATKAFTTIFSRHARSNDVMTSKELLAYVDQGLGLRLNGQQLRKKFDRHNLSKDGRLHLRDFLAFQADQAEADVGAVWRDLHAHGFNCQLQDTSVSVAQPEGLSEVLDLEKHPLPIHPASRDIANLERIGFYERGLQFCISATNSIMRRLSVAENQLAISLITQSLEDISIFAESYGNNQQNVVRPSLGLAILRVLLTTDHPNPEIKRNWMKIILLNDRPFGLLVLLNVMDENISKLQADKKFKHTRVQARLIDSIRILNEIPEFHEYCMSLCEENEDIRRLMGHIQEPLVSSSLAINNPAIDSTAMIVDPVLSSRLKRSKVIVSNATNYDFINGEYRFYQFHSDQTGKNNISYKKVVPLWEGREDQLFLVHRCRLHNGGYNWYISHIPDGKKPGEQSDRDFYEKYSQYDSATRMTDDMTPPRKYWKISGEKYAISDDIYTTWIPGPDDATLTVDDVDRDIDEDLEQLNLGMESLDTHTTGDLDAISINDATDTGGLTTDTTGGLISSGIGAIGMGFHDLGANVTSTFDSIATYVAGGVRSSSDVYVDQDDNDSASSERADPNSDRSLDGHDNDDFDLTNFHSD